MCYTRSVYIYYISLQNLKEYEVIYVTFAVDLVILIVFSVEMLIKILRLGLITPRVKVSLLLHVLRLL